MATAIATFLLLIAGGLVSTTESGLACPDWPLCEGKVIPEMRDGKQFEHTHRLIASFVGTMTFGLAALLYKHRRQDRLLVWLGVVASALVTVQALLGATTVWLQLPAWVSATHLGTAMAFFALSVSLAFLTWQRLPGTEPRRLADPERAAVLRVLAPAVVLTYAQLVIGAAMRHVRGGLSCGFEVLTCNGELWPLDGHLGVQLHMTHRLVGVLAGVAILWFGHVTWRRAAGSAWLRGLAVAASLGVLAQVTLGFLTVVWSRELVTMTVHSSLAAALLAALVSAWWLAAPSAAPDVEAARRAASIGSSGAGSSGTGPSLPGSSPEVA